MKYNIQDLIKKAVSLEKRMIDNNNKQALIDYLNLFTQIKTIVEDLRVTMFTDFLENNWLQQFSMLRTDDNIATVIIAEWRPKEIVDAAKNFRRCKILLARMHKFIDALPDSYLKVNITDLEVK